MDKTLLSQALCSHDTSAIKNVTPVSGGCINQAYKVTTQNDSYFIKLNLAENLSMFEQEAFGIEKFKPFSIRIPRVISFGRVEENFSYLTLEWIELCSPNTACEIKLGHKLAQLHHDAQNSYFGFDINNTIGATPQLNPQAENWVAFFGKYRLAYQIKRIQQQYDDDELALMVNKVIEALPSLFAGVTMTPCLLHGDLWSGNWAMDKQSEPVIFDPAPFYGHHEFDFAILEMFGSPSKAFYDAYEAILPLTHGFKVRLKIYQLYHYLNHYNLFGQQYRLQCLHLAKEILRG